MGELAKWAQENSPFLRIPDDGEVRVLYRGFKVVEDTRDPSKTKIRYIVEFEGKQKWFESAAGRVAMVMDTVGEGEEIIIKKEIVGGKAKYSVRKAEEVPGPLPWEGEKGKEKLSEKELATISKKTAAKTKSGS
jgi:hypothetical protein